MDVWDPVIADAGRSTMAMLERTSASPATAAAVYEAASTSDVRDVLGLIRCPVRVLRHPSFTLPEASVRLVAERIPNATYHVLPSSQPYMGLLEPARPAVEHLLDLSSGGGATPEFDRELATLLFTDVVGSTELLERMGDAAWSDVRRRHEHDIRSAVEAAGGALVDVAGDGSFSLLGGPAAAIRCAREISERAAPLGLTIRSGVHFGECQRNGGGVTGLAVHIAARVGAAARPGEIWVSRTVRDVVGGSGIRLRSRGVHELKGVPEPWELYAVADDDDDVSVPAEPPRVRPTDRALVTMARRAPRVMRAVARLDGARRRRAAGVRVAG
jgi:class 3 adenylate cyclase